MKQICTIEITPQLADEYLSRNISNRPMNLEKVNLLKEIILSGQWNLKKGRIEFSEDGRLLNGQHRLTAIKLSGKSVPVRVIFY